MDPLVSPQLNTNQQKIKETIINFIIPLICLAATGVLGFVVIYPAFKTIPELKDKLTVQTTLKQNLTTKNLLLKKLVDFKSMLDENSNLIDKVLVSEANVPQLLDQTSQIAGNAGLKVSKLNYSYGEMAEQKDSGGFKRVDVSLSTEGSYDQVILFLQNVEGAARVLYTTNFRYSKDVDNGTIFGTFSLESPYLFVKSDAITDDPLSLDITNQNFLSFINKIKGLRYYEFINKDIVVEEVRESTTSGQ
jgi:Tfp pilus assembly protein PilO